MLRLSLIFLVAVSCTDPASSGDTPDAATPCVPVVTCFPGCGASDASCLKGTLDTVACACVGADGAVVPWPSGASLSSLEWTTPVPPKVPVLKPIPIALTARFADGSARDATASAVLTTDPPGALDAARAPKATGPITITATVTISGVTRTVETSTRALVEEARAVWVTRFAFTKAADIQRIVNAAADAKFNIVMLQVRGNGDAYYASTLEPWAAGLGALGKDPGWDPLQVGIDAAHARGIELHAYVNAFTAWSGASTPPASASGAPTHILRAHPEWVETNQAGTTLGDGYQWLSPGIEAVRKHNTDVVREILQKYNIDGIHLDRIRYSESSMGWNALSRAAFESAGGGNEAAFRAWRTGNVNDQVHRISDAIAELKPGVQLSAAVWGIHTRLPNCSTSQGIDLYQDSLAWTEGGYIDALCPMIYWMEGSGCTDYGDLVAQFMARKADRMIWAGMHVLSKKPDGSCNNCDDNRPALNARIDVARSAKAEGVTLFASAYLDQYDVWKFLGDGRFAEEALVPKATR